MPKDRFNFIKLKINTNKELTTMIDSQRYILNDTNELVNKIAEKKISKNNAIKAYNNLVNKLEKTDLPDSSYSIANIQDYFEFIIKKHETLTENPLIQIYPNKIKKRIAFKIKTGYKLELLTLETMRLLGSTKKDVDADKNSENAPKLESVEVVLVHCNLVKNDYQHTSKVLFSFVPNNLDS